METFKFTDLSGVERTLSSEGGAAFTVSNTGTDDKLIEWIENRVKRYCFVIADAANGMVASGLSYIQETPNPIVLHEPTGRFVSYERHPLFPDHDQIRLQLAGGGEALIDARHFAGIQHSDISTGFVAHFKYGAMFYITEKCYNNLAKYLKDRNAILDLNEGDGVAKAITPHQEALLEIIGRIELGAFELGSEYEDAIDEIAAIAANSIGIPFLGVGARNELAATEE